MATEKFFVFNEAGTLKRLKGRIVRFLDNEDPSGSDKSAIRTSLEVSPDAEGLVQADVGTAPNEIPVNGMLGSMAYQSADSVSMANAEVETLEVTDQASIGATSGAIGAADDDAALVLQQSVGGVAELSRATDTDGHVVGKVNFANRNNSNTVNPGSANYPAVAGIEAQLETSDSNLHDDSGGHLVFKTKPEAGLIAERLRLDSQGRLAVGTSSPIGKLEVAVAPTTSATTVNETADFADSAIISHTGSSANGDRIPLVFNVGNNGTNGISAAIVGERETSGWNSALSFWTNNVTSGSEGTDAIQEAIRITSDKNLVMTGGGGIDFGTTTTGSGSVATNGGLLADYEFGDFTMTAGGTWTVTPTATSGKYVKVGNLVTCFVVFTGSPTKASSTSGWLQGLPFATNAYAGLGSVSDTSVADRGNCYAGNTDRLWLTGTSFGATNYATVSYRHD